MKIDQMLMKNVNSENAFFAIAPRMRAFHAVGYPFVCYLKKYIKPSVNA